MARLNTNAELWSHLSTFYLLKDTSTGISTTIDAALSAGGSTGSIVLGSTAMVGNYARLGPSGGAEMLYIEAGSTIAFTARSLLAESHSSGEAFIELSQVDLGALSDAGLQPAVESDRTRIDVATQRHRYAWHIAHTDFVVTGGLENLSWENLLESCGISSTAIHGAGSAADPNVADWNPEDFDTIDPLHFAAEGALKDGTNVRVEFWDCDFDPGKALQLARGQDTPLGFAFSARRIRWLNPIS